MPRRRLLYDAEIVARVELDRLLCVTDCHVVDTLERLLGEGLVITLKAVDRISYLVHCNRCFVSWIFIKFSLNRSVSVCILNGLFFILFILLLYSDTRTNLLLVKL